MILCVICKNSTFSSIMAQHMRVGPKNTRAKARILLGSRACVGHISAKAVF